MFVDSINYRHFLLALRVLCNSHYTDIYVSSSYVVLSTTGHKYVIGLADGDNRFFVNKVSRELSSYELVVSFRKGERRITIYTTTNEEVWDIMGFEYNTVGEEIVIEKTGVYRVQGDLVLEVDDYKPAPLLNELANVQERLLLDMLLRVLTEMRVTAQVGDGGNIIVPLFMPVEDARKAITNFDTIRDMVVERAASTLYERLREIGLARGLSRPSSWKAIIDADGEYANCDIRVFDGSFTHAYDILPYVRMNLIIAPKCSPNMSEGTLLKKMYDDFMQLYKPRTFEFTVGNHHIRMENAYSMMLRYRPKWQPVVLGDLVVEIDVDQGWYHVTPKTIVTITHDEHGITRVRFTREFEVRFGTLTLSERHAHERNAIALNLIPT
jgi:hypothetical protein